MMKIAIIDSGINPQKFERIHLAKKLYVQNGKIVPDYRLYYPNNHGTVCASVIDKYLAHDISLISINVFNGRRGNINNLILALKWCFHNKVKLINLSCGSVDETDGALLKKVMEHYDYSKGIIVAAQSNANYRTYPACLSKVLGVACNANCHGYQYEMKKDIIHNIDIKASGIHKIFLNNKVHVTTPSNSFATAFISSVIINLIMEKQCSLSMDNILKELAQNPYNKEKSDSI